MDTDSIIAHTYACKILALRKSDMVKCEGCGSAEAHIEHLKGQLTEKDELIARLQVQLAALEKPQREMSTSLYSQIRRYLHSRLRKMPPQN